MMCKKLFLTLLTASTLLGTGISAQAKCPPHDFSNRSYISSRTVSHSHEYLYGYFPDGSVDIRTCNYHELIVLLRFTCVDCGADSDKTEEVSYSDRGHSCGR